MFKYLKTFFVEIAKLVSRNYRRKKREASRGFRALRARRPSIDVLTVAVTRFRNQRIKLPTAYFSYHAFLSIFPLLLLLSAILGFVLHSNPNLQQEIMNYVYDAFPNFGGTLRDILESVVASRRLVGILGLLGFLWTGSKIALSLQIGFNVIWEADRMEYVEKRLYSLLILLAMGAIVVLTVSINFFSSRMLSWIAENAGPLWSAISFLAGLIISLCLNFILFFSLYLIVPRERPSLRPAAIGALFSAVVFHISEYFFNYYFANISKAKLLYGTIGIVIGILVWLFIIGAVLFLGAEIVYILERRRKERVEEG